MLTLFHNGQELVLDNTDYYVRELASGLDEIIFDISIWDPMYALMNEEDNIVDRGGQRYLIKQIDAGAETANVICQLDLDEWKKTLSVKYNSGTKTVAQQIDAVKPTGWSVLDFSGSSIGRTIAGDLTPFGVCEECRNTYKVYVRWDNKTKTCMIYSKTMGSPVGSFATRELNLKEINYKGKSQNFATRLYAYGKDGLSFASINDGKAYVDNNTYSSRVICAYWEDERYTDASSLLEDARAKLAKLAVPERSYDCAIVDLRATNPLEYNNLDFSLFTVATLIDDVKNTAVNYQVVERHVWPYHPELNEVIFDSAPVKIQNSVIQIEDEIINPQSDFQQILQARIEMVTDWLTNSDSHVYIVEDEAGGIREFLFVNGDQPIETATQVMRLNASGLGFSKTGVNGLFTNAFVFDSVMGGHLVADFITAGSMLANRIRGGTLESIDNDHNYLLNLTTGEQTVKKGSIKLGLAETYGGSPRYNFDLANSGVLGIGWDTTNHRHRLSFDGSNLTLAGNLSAAGGTFCGTCNFYKADDPTWLLTEINPDITGVQKGSIIFHGDTIQSKNWTMAAIDAVGVRGFIVRIMDGSNHTYGIFRGGSDNTHTVKLNIDENTAANLYITGKLTVDGYTQINGGLKVNTGAELNGTCTVNGETITSDRRLKKGIHNLAIKKAKDLIMSLIPKVFRYRDNDKYLHHGFVAQDVVKRHPWLIRYIDDDIMGIAYQSIIADLVLVTQEQEHRIKNLEKRLDALERRR